MVKRILPSYYGLASEFINVVIAIDASDAELLDLCLNHGYECLMSEEGEGVGISKNRVFDHYSDYDHYFFIEDDVELRSASYFIDQIEIAEGLNIPHFSMHPYWRLKNIQSKVTYKDHTIVGATFGSAQVNYFSKKCLHVIGGWHQVFAQVKRFGHTEHSYRTINNGLCKFPFNYVLELERCFKFWEPPSATQVKVEKDTETSLSKMEMDLMNEKLLFHPISFKSPYKVHIPTKSDQASLEQEKSEGMSTIVKLRTHALNLSTKNPIRWIILLGFKIMRATK